MGSYASQVHPGTSLEGRVALITGAGRGLGAGIARELASRGASVVLNYSRSAKAALSVVADIESQGGSAVAIQADISRPSEVTKLFDAAVAHFGLLDVVVNNAGMESFANEEDVTEKMFDEVFALNTRAQFFVAQHALKHLSRVHQLHLTCPSLRQPSYLNLTLAPHRRWPHNIHVLGRCKHVRRFQPRPIRRLESRRRGLHALLFRRRWSQRHHRQRHRPRRHQDRNV